MHMFQLQPTRPQVSEVPKRAPGSLSASTPRTVSTPVYGVAPTHARAYTQTQTCKRSRNVESSPTQATKPPQPATRAHTPTHAHDHKHTQHRTNQSHRKPGASANKRHCNTAQGRNVQPRDRRDSADHRARGAPHPSSDIGRGTTTTRAANTSRGSAVTPSSNAEETRSSSTADRGTTPARATSVQPTLVKKRKGCIHNNENHTL